MECPVVWKMLWKDHSSRRGFCSERQDGEEEREEAARERGPRVHKEQNPPTKPEFVCWMEWPRECLRGRGLGFSLANCSLTSEEVMSDSWGPSAPHLLSLDHVPEVRVLSLTMCWRQEWSRADVCLFSASLHPTMLM
jgi:hypothetical protein